MKFTKKQIDRYSRQIILKKIGVVGQKKLLKSNVLIVGDGAIGLLFLPWANRELFSDPTEKVEA